MIYQIGVLDNDVRLGMLIKNRIPAELLFSGQMRLYNEEKRYVGVEVDKKENLFLLSDILADILIENLQIRYILHRVEKLYPFIDKSEQGDVLITALKRLWFATDKSDVKCAKEDLGNRISICLLESKTGVLSLDGVMRFRMADHLLTWDSVLQRCVEEYLVETQKDEFIRLLRYFVSMRDPVISFVKIVPSNNVYTMFDSNGDRVTVAVNIYEGETKEDHLLSQLISLSPESIDAREIDDFQLKDLLRQVFVGRVHV